MSPANTEARFATRNGTTSNFTIIATQTGPNNYPNYTGNFKNDKPEGKGLEYYEAGKKKYAGDWKDGLKHGQGTLYYESGKKQYVGNFVDGKFSGHGMKFDKEDELEYEGEFLDDCMHGYGTVWDEGEKYYEGVMDYDSITGKGLMYSDAKRWYQGEFKNGYPHGQGTMFGSDEMPIYTGKFVDGAFESENENVQGLASDIINELDGDDIEPIQNKNPNEVAEVKAHVYESGEDLVAGVLGEIMED